MEKVITDKLLIILKYLLIGISSYLSYLFWAFMFILDTGNHSSWYYNFFPLLYFVTWIIPVSILFFKKNLTYKNLSILIVAESIVIITLYVIAFYTPREIWDNL